MTPVKWAGAWCLFGAVFLQAQPQWRQMETENFRIYSQANERDTRVALQYFERVRSFFITLTGEPPEDPVPAYIVMFNSEKEYAPYRISEAAIAYYFGGSERDYIVMGKTGEQTAHAATHEYVHLVHRHAHFNFPPWLEEGIAELFSTLKVIGNNTEFGNIIPGRMASLYREKWVPLATILAVDHDSPYYNEKDQAGMFYSESWALVHMLATSREYRPGWDKAISAIVSGVPAVQALETAYGKPFEKIEGDLRLYIRGDSFRRLVMDAGVETTKLKDPSTPADSYDVNLALADLLNREGQLEERKRRLEELTRSNPSRPEAWASLGYAAWRSGDADIATEHFAKAFELGARSPKLLWDYGRLAAGTDLAAARTALDELVKREPGNVEARLDLASVYARSQQWGMVVITVQPIKEITPALAPRLFSVLGPAQLQMGQRDEARATAQNLMKYARNDRERNAAQQMLDYLDRVAEQERVQAERARLAASAPVRTPRPAEEPEAQPVAAPSAAAPGLIRREPTEEEIRRTILHDANGRFVELLCTGDTASMVLETAEGRKQFRILDPNRIVVTGSRDGFASLQCGPQPNPSPCAFSSWKRRRESTRMASSARFISRSSDYGVMRDSPL